MLGQAFLGVAQPFFLDSPALVATYWFENSMREVAITLGTNLNVIGMAFGFILPTFFVDEEVVDIDRSRNQIALSLMVQAGIAIVLMLFAIFSFQNKPAVPPSSNATVERDDSLCVSYGKLFCNFEFLKLSMCFSLYFSIIIVLSTVIDKIVEEHGFNSNDSGFFGTMNVVGGVIGSSCYGLFLKRWKWYKTCNILIGISSMISIAAFYFALQTETKWIVTLSYAFVGFTVYPTMNVSFAYNSEITFPIKEATASGLFILGSQFIGFGLTNLISILIDELGTKAIFILVGTTLIGTISAIIMKPIPKARNNTLRKRAASTYQDSLLAEEESIDMHEAHWVK